MREKRTPTTNLSNYKHVQKEVGIFSLFKQIMELQIEDPKSYIIHFNMKKKKKDYFFFYL